MSEARIQEGDKTRLSGVGMALVDWVKVGVVEISSASPGQIGYCTLGFLLGLAITDDLETARLSVDEHVAAVISC